MVCNANCMYNTEHTTLILQTRYISSLIPAHIIIIFYVRVQTSFIDFVLGFGIAWPSAISSIFLGQLFTITLNIFDVRTSIHFIQMHQRLVSKKASNFKKYSDHVFVGFEGEMHDFLGQLSTITLNIFDHVKIKSSIKHKIRVNTIEFLIKSLTKMH